MPEAFGGLAEVKIKTSGVYACYSRLMANKLDKMVF